MEGAAATPNRSISGKKSTKESFNANATKDCNRNKDDPYGSSTEAFGNEIDIFSDLFRDSDDSEDDEIERKDLYESVVSRIFITYCT